MRSTLLSDFLLFFLLLFAVLMIVNHQDVVTTLNLVGRDLYGLVGGVLTSAAAFVRSLLDLTGLV